MWQCRYVLCSCGTEGSDKTWFNLWKITAMYVWRVAARDRIDGSVVRRREGLQLGWRLKEGGDKPSQGRYGLIDATFYISLLLYYTLCRLLHHLPDSNSQRYMPLKRRFLTFFSARTPWYLIQFFRTPCQKLILLKTAETELLKL